MRKLLLAVSILFVLILCLFAIPALAQVDPGPTPVPTPVADPAPGLFSIFIGPSVLKWLTTSAMVFLLVEALKNVPFFADFFVKFPKLSVWVNAALALTAALGACIGLGGHVEGFGFIQCALTAIGTFLGAAGLHYVKFSLSPAKTERSGDGVLRTALSPSVSRKTRESVGVALPPPVNPTGGNYTSRR